MKKVVLASLLAVAGAAYCWTPAIAQTPVSLGQQQSSQVQMSADEYAAYNNAVTQKDPAAKAAAYEAYLKAYPKSAVKADALEQLMLAYNAANEPDKTLDAADRLLAVEPTSFRALVFETLLRETKATSLTDPAAKLAGLNDAAGYAQRGLADPKPAGMDEADFKQLQDQGFPIFYGALATDDLQKKDNVAAEKAFSQELQSVPLASTEAPGTLLQDTYYLAVSYYTQTPPDYFNCAYYAARAAAFAPEPYKTNFNKLGEYCYTKYHGSATGYETLTTDAQAKLVAPPVCNMPPVIGTPATTPAASTTPAAGATPAPAATPLTPAGCIPVSPAPKPEDYVTNLIATTPDLATLAISDKEFVIEYGKPADAQKVFDTIKGKSVELPGVTVVSATPNLITVSVSSDAVQNKVADFSFTIKDPIKDADVPAVGATITIDGTYDSFTQKPLLINMINGALVLPKKAAPVHHYRRR
jgi:hypothetical protein